MTAIPVPGDPRAGRAVPGGRVRPGLPGSLARRAAAAAQPGLEGRRSLRVRAGTPPGPGSPAALGNPGDLGDLGSLAGRGSPAAPGSHLRGSPRRAIRSLRRARARVRVRVQARGVGRARARAPGRRRAVAAVARGAEVTAPTLIVRPVVVMHTGLATRDSGTVTGRRIRRSQKGLLRPILIE